MTLSDIYSDTIDGVLRTDGYANTHDTGEKGNCIIEGQGSET